MPETAPVSDREERILQIIETTRAKRPKFKDAKVTMSHGAGGKATQTLIEGLFAPAFASAALDELGDAGGVEVEGTRLALTTDSFVVKPIRFPGGSIGELAVNGTVERPRGRRCEAAGPEPVPDPRGGPDADELRARGRGDRRRRRGGRVEIVDRRHEGRRARPLPTACTSARRDRPGRPAGSLSPRGLRAGRPHPGLGHGRRPRLGDHARPRTSSRSTPRSTRHRPLWPAVDALLDAAGRTSLHARRHPRRVASVLNELARASGVAISVREADVPVNPAVAGAAEMLGIDPMYVANEGKLVAFVAPDRAQEALEALRSVPGLRASRGDRRGEGEPPGMVLVETAFGGKRVMDQLVGDPLPRIWLKLDNR
jgi:hydrogenase expression/formation protein HypE